MNKKTQKIIQAINDAVPKELRDAVLTKEYIAPDLRITARETVAEMREAAEEMTGNEREQALKEAQRLQNIIDAGYYDQKEWRVNKEAAAKVEAWIDAELDKAIKEGRIPHPKDDKDYQRYQRKLKQNERRTTKKSAIRGIGAGTGSKEGSRSAD